MKIVLNNIKVGIRLLINNKGYSFINILGLTISISFCWAILLWVRGEVSTNKFHSNSDNLYVVYMSAFYQGESDGMYGTPAMLAEELKKDIPGIIHSSGFAWDHNETFEYRDKKLKFNGSRAGRDFFKMFDFEVLHGDGIIALSDNSGMAISRSMAEALFEDASLAIGESLKVNNQYEFVVQAVFEDTSNNSSLQFDYLINWDNIYDQTPLLERWDVFWTKAFVQLDPNANSIAIDAKIEDFISKFYKDDIEGLIREIHLQPFDEMYLNGEFENGAPKGGRIFYVQVFSAVAFLVVLLCCINFVNLTTALSLKRAKEVAIRKVNGAARLGITFQYMMDSLVQVLLGAAISILGTCFLVSFINEFLDKQIVLSFTDVNNWIAFISTVISIGIISGFYPAFVISSLNPKSILRGQSKLASRKATAGVLTVIQFSFAIIFIISSYSMSSQVNYLLNNKSGINKVGLVYLAIEDNLKGSYQIFKDEILKIHGVFGVDKASQRPHSMNFNTDEVIWEGKLEGDLVVSTPISVGYDFIELMDLKLVQGRNFSRVNENDNNNFIVNEKAIESFGYEDPIGKSLQVYDKKGKIIGVVSDFSFKSLHKPIYPLAIDLKENLEDGHILIKVNPEASQSVLTEIKKVYNKFNSNIPFDFSYAEDEYYKLYENEKLTAQVVNAFSLLSIVLCAMGLIGLVSYSAEQRIKETAIRKVLGASDAEILKLFIVHFIRYVGIALLIAIPTSWYLIQQWLNNFAYRVPINLEVILLIVAGIGAVAALIIFSSSIKVIKGRPVSNLRIE